MGEGGVLSQLTDYPKGKLIKSRTGAHGRATGTVRFCQMEGCTGFRVGVRWRDGSITWPCTKGIRNNRLV